MKRNLLTLVAVVTLATLSSHPAYSADGSPSWFGDAQTTFLFNTDTTQTAGASPNLYQFRYGYHIGVYGDFDWLDYLVELGSAQSVNDPRVVLTPAAPAVALSRAKITLHVVDTLFLDFGRFDNPLAFKGWDFVWDNDYKTTGLAQRIEVGNFFANAVEHFATLSVAGAQTSVAGGSHLGTSAIALLGANIGYNWEFSDGFMVLVSGEIFNIVSNTQAGLNASLNWDVREGYPFVVWVGGYLPLSNTAGTGKTLTASVKAQYGDLSMDDSYMLSVSGTYIGANSYLSPVGGIVLPANVARWGVTAAGLAIPASERLSRTAAVLLAAGSATAGSAINVGLDAFYRFYSWFELGLEADFGFSSGTTLTDTSFIHAELVARTEF